MVQKITIKRMRKSNKLQTIANVRLRNGKTIRVVVDNVDYFLTNLENHINEVIIIFF